MVKDIHVLDVVMATSSYSLSDFSMLFDGLELHEIESSDFLNNKIRQVSEEKNISLKEGRIITGDVFDPYIDDTERYNNLYPQDLDVLASEMEAYALFFMARRFNRNASCLVTIVDSKYEDKEITSDEREKSLDDMIVLSLEAIIK